MPGRRGLTLAETLVALALMAVLSTSLLAAVNLSLFHWVRLGNRVDAASSARLAMSALTQELRGGLPDSTPNGYLRLTPAVSPTAVLTPNANVPNATELVFTEADPVRWDPLSAGFDASDPSLYRRVRYRAVAGRILREVTTFTSAGSVSEVREALVARGDRAALAVAWRAPDLFDVQATVGVGAYESVLLSRIHVVGR